MKKPPEDQTNPFAYGSAEEMARVIASLMPRPQEDTRTEEEKHRFEEERKRRREEYHEARYGSLPENTYRILEQGGFMGWHYELEVGDKIISLKDGEDNPFAVFGNEAQAVEVAKKHLSEILGSEASEAAMFRFVFGGQL